MPEAHNKAIVEALYNEEGLDSGKCVVRLGKSCADILQILRAKRVIIGQVRDDEIESIKEDAPDIDERAGMGAMLAVLESKDGKNDDSSITSAAKDCITLAVDEKILERKGASPCNWFVHHSSLGKEYKAAFGKNIAIYSAMNVADNVLLVSVLDGDTLSDAKVLAEGQGFDSIDEWSLGRFAVLVAVPSILSKIEMEMEMAIGALCQGFLCLLGDDFVDTWRRHGDKILLPDEDDKIGFSATAPDYFSDVRKGTTRKTGVLLNLLTVFQSPIIAFCHGGDVDNIDFKQLATAVLRCSTKDIIAKAKLLKQGDLFFSQNAKKISDAKKFVGIHLKALLKTSKGRAGIYLKYCIFLDLRRDIHQQLELLLKILDRSDLELDILQR